MKVKCIYKNNWSYLTTGKTYYAINGDDYCYIIINDNGHRYWYPKKFFKPLSEYRIEKINKLLE